MKLSLINIITTLVLISCAFSSNVYIRITALVLLVMYLSFILYKNR